MLRAQLHTNSPTPIIDRNGKIKTENSPHQLFRNNDHVPGVHCANTFWEVRLITEAPPVNHLLLKLNTLLVEGLQVTKLLLTTLPDIVRVTIATMSKHGLHLTGVKAPENERVIS